MASPTPFSSIPAAETVLKLPHPYRTEYTLTTTATNSSSSYTLTPKPSSDSSPLPFPLHNPLLSFSDPVHLKSSQLPPSGVNSSWARARRSPCVSWTWFGDDAPTLAQAWLHVYALFTLRPGTESLRLDLRGKGARQLGKQLVDVLLAVEHPLRGREKREPSKSDDESLVLALRTTFWQGAGSPFGPRPIWLPASSPSSLPASTPLGNFPLTAHYNTVTIASSNDAEDPDRCRESWHPVRAAKPAPGTVIYSRWIPHLKETFSMVAVDCDDEEHLRLFHEWQNDPRVSQGWEESGTVERHVEYLRRVHEDPHVMGVLAKFDDTYFAYFEIYWAKVSFPFTPSPYIYARLTFVGGPPRRRLPSRPLRPRPALPRRRRALPGPSPRVRVVEFPAALYVPGRPPNGGRRRRAQGDEYHRGHVRLCARVRD